MQVNVPAMNDSARKKYLHTSTRVWRMYNLLLMLCPRVRWKVRYLPSLHHVDYLYVGASSSNYVALCTQLSPDAVQRICMGSIVQPATQSRYGLRPSSSHFSVPRTRTKFGERAFSYAGPSAWNTLPRHIRETVDSASFRKLLKTHYFTSAFDVVW